MASNHKGSNDFPLVNFKKEKKIYTLQEIYSRPNEAFASEVMIQDKIDLTVLSKRSFAKSFFANFILEIKKQKVV